VAGAVNRATGLGNLGPAAQWISPKHMLEVVVLSPTR
jgi:hypothetical protein